MLLECVMLIAVSYLLSSDKQLWKQLSCMLLVTPKPGLLHVNNTLLRTPLAKWGFSEPAAEQHRCPSQSQSGEPSTSATPHQEGQKQTLSRLLTPQQLSLAGRQKAIKTGPCSRFPTHIHMEGQRGGGDISSPSETGNFLVEWQAKHRHFPGPTQHQQVGFIFFLPFLPELLAFSKNPWVGSLVLPCYKTKSHLNLEQKKY